MYLFFDTETTGLPKDYQAPIENLDNWPRLVQIAWLIFDKNGQEIVRYSQIIKPEGFIIPEQASRIHGITTDKALEKGIALEQVLQDFNSALEKNKILIAHNISFDEKIIQAEFLRKNIKNNFFEIKKICTKEASTDFCQIPGRFGYKWPNLAELHQKLFNSDFLDAHDALADVQACARCFFALKDRGVIAD